MSKPLPFTEASIARAIKGVERAGRFVIGVRPDGTLIVGDKPVDTASMIPEVPQSSPPPAKRRIGEKVHGDQGAA
jgi:hypothetical protein